MLHKDKPPPTSGRLTDVIISYLSEANQLSKTYFKWAWKSLAQGVTLDTAGAFVFDLYAAALPLP